MVDKNMKRVVAVPCRRGRYYSGDDDDDDLLVTDQIGWLPDLEKDITIWSKECR